tara:strand:+ start:144 stop:422 length:279 start_codon:yes stop_codon:yes gene_type:complete
MQNEATILSEALTIYAQAAFPKGGSECSQVLRESLLDSAKILTEEHDQDFVFKITKRHKDLVKSGLKWYLSNDGKKFSEQGNEILKKLNKKN